MVIKKIVSILLFMTMFSDYSYGLPSIFQGRRGVRVVPLKVPDGRRTVLSMPKYDQPLQLVVPQGNLYPSRPVVSLAACFACCCKEDMFKVFQEKLLERMASFDRSVDLALYYYDDRPTEFSPLASFIVPKDINMTKFMSKLEGQLGAISRTLKPGDFKIRVYTGYKSDTGRIWLAFY